MRYRLQMICLLWIMACQVAWSYDETHHTYFPPLTPPTHLIVAPDFPTGVGNVTSEASLELDLYITSLDGQGRTSALTFVFFNDPYFSGYAQTTIQLTGRPTGQWQHVSVLKISMPFQAGMSNWNTVGILQVQSALGAYDVWIDNCGFKPATTTTLTNVLVNGTIDNWGGTFTTMPSHGTPPVALVPSAGAATRFVAPGGTNPWANLSRPTIGQNFVTMVSSLAGLLLKQGHTEGLWLGAVDQTFTQLVNRRGITYDVYNAPQTFWDVVDHFKPQFGANYVLYDNQANPDSTNAARMAAYQQGALMVDKSIEAEAQAHGLTRVADVSSYDDAWIKANWWPTWPRRDMAIDAATGLDGVQLNDYAAAAGAVCFRDNAGTPLRLAYLDELDDDSPVLGWPDEGYGELYSTQDNSLHDTFNVAAASHLNVALLSAFRDVSKFPLSPPTRPLPSNANKHTVAFLWSDGDNVSWHEVLLPWNTNWWASPQRGQFPVGWGINPACRDLGQPNVEYMYATAISNVTAQDDFVAFGPIGYAYPSQFSASARSLNATRLNAYMGDLGLRVLNILDKSGFDNAEVYTPYLQQPNIDAMFYWDVWGNYAKYSGATKWVAGKPIITMRRMMSDADALTTLNSLPTDPANPNSYSLVGIPAWSATLADVGNFIAQLGPNVKVVGPNELARLFIQNVAPLTTFQEIDRGNWQLASYGATSGAMTVSVNSNAVQVDGTPSTRVTISSTYDFSNMYFAPVNASQTSARLMFDLYGDGSGAAIRLELYSSVHGGFLYVDIPLNFSGWRHYEYALDGSTGLNVYNGTFAQIASSLNIWQISGSWNSIPATFAIDNVRLAANVPTELSQFLTE